MPPPASNLPQQRGRPLRTALRRIEPPPDRSAWRRWIVAQPGGFALESVALDPRYGRYSFFGHAPIRRIEAAPDGDPLTVLAAAVWPWQQYSPVPVLPFIGGWVGYLTYEAGGTWEPKARSSRVPQNLPIAQFALHDTVVVADHAHDAWFVAGVDHPNSTTALEKRLKALEGLVRDTPAALPTRDIAALPRAAAVPDMTPEQYAAMIRRALDYIAAGDIFQVNLAQRFTVPCRVPAAELYDALCRANPASYAAFIPVGTGLGPETPSPLKGEGRGEGDSVETGPISRSRPLTPTLSPEGERACESNSGSDAQPPAQTDDGATEPQIAILSSSPELFLQLRTGRVLTRPIKGTRRRTGDAALDAAALEDLQRSPKDRAELAMIVDLERNDLGRVCRYGSVRVDNDGAVEAHPTVFHRVATIIGQLRPDRDAIDLLRATFPGGSITGAPKVRAMQIIDELERSPRGAYCGAIGYLGLDGSMMLNLAIRTLVVEGRQAYVSVGGGIVSDSNPQAEYDETLAKAAGMLEALGVAR